MTIVRKAVIDVGSNSVLLTVAELGATGWAPVFETSTVTALGEGTKQTGLIGEVSMARTLAAIATGFQDARAAGAVDIVCAGTMALRIASNAAEFTSRAEAQNTPVEIISGEQEAELGLRAVLEDPAFAGHSRVSIVDVGGHSTEIVIAEPDRTLFRRSFSIGTLGLRGAMPDRGGVVTPPELMRLCAQIDEIFGFCCLPFQAGHTVALGATGTNLITIRDRMAAWDPTRVHAEWLDYEEVSKAAGWLCPMTDVERAAIVGLEPGREKSLHLGALILERGLFALRTLGCSVSVRGWRYGLL